MAESKKMGVPQVGENGISFAVQHIVETGREKMRTEGSRGYCPHAAVYITKRKCLAILYWAKIKSNRRNQAGGKNKVHKPLVTSKLTCFSHQIYHRLLLFLECTCGKGMPWLVNNIFLLWF